MENLQPQRVFYYFSKLMEIPRPSFHEIQMELLQIMLKNL